MRALVLGGTQFISQAVAVGLIARGCETSILTRGLRDVAYTGLAGRYRADRKDAASMEQVRGERFDAVFDCSGYEARDVRVVLDALRPDGETSYVFLSSGAVYLPSDNAVAEDAPRGENGVWGAYGAGKLEAENALVREQRRRGFSLSIVRPAYVYGPGNNLYRESYLFERIARGEPVPVPDGKALTQFAYIDDVVRLLLGLPGAHDGVEAFNCAYPDPVDWEMLVGAAGAAVGVEPRIKRVDCAGRMDARTFFPFRDCTYLLDTAKAERFGLKQPSVELEEGMRRAYAWCCCNRTPCPDAKMVNIEVALAL